MLLRPIRKRLPGRRQANVYPPTPRDPHGVIHINVDVPEEDVQALIDHALLHMAGLTEDYIVPLQRPRFELIRGERDRGAC